MQHHHCQQFRGWTQMVSLLSLPKLVTEPKYTAKKKQPSENPSETPKPAQPTQPCASHHPTVLKFSMMPHLALSVVTPPQSTTPYQLPYQHQQSHTNARTPSATPNTAQVEASSQAKTKATRYQPAETTRTRPGTTPPSASQHNQPSMMPYLTALLLVTSTATISSILLST